jgi:protein SCO1
MKLWGFVLIAAFLASSLIVVGALRMRAPSASSAEAFTEKPHRLEPLWAAPDFSFVDHQGATITPATLARTPYVANFIFTTCKTVCPLLTSKMVQAQRALAGVPVQFLSFSVDPAHDTREALLAYSKQWNATEPRWHLLATQPDTLTRVTAGFHITAEANTMPNALDPIIHSAVFVLVDGAGQVRGIYDSEHREDFDAMLRDTRALANAPPGATVLVPTGKSGEVLYHELSCVACHERPELAPSLRGLLGKARELEAANLVTADRAYLRESIVYPDNKRVRGYPLKMPSYDGLLADADLTTLVEWIATRPADGPAAPGVTVETDVVCHMKVRAEPTALHLEYDGRTFWFCSELCRDRFVKTPEAFAK